MKVKTLVALVVVLALLFTAGAVFARGGRGEEPAEPEETAAPAEKAEKPKKAPEQVLIFGSSGDVARLDPGDVTDGESIQRMDNIFEALVEFKPGSTEIQPGLATSWKFSDNGKEITFNLRKGVKFHDGTDFNADAVVYSFERQYNPDHPHHQYGQWAYWGWMFYDINRVEKIDDYTVKIYMNVPNASIMLSLAMFTANIVSPANAEKWGEDAFAHPSGTGPFKFVEWVKDDHITLEAYDDYWKGRPKLDRLIFRVIPDPSARLLALEAGEVLGIEYPNPADFDRIENNDDLVLMSEPGMNVGYLALNAGYGYNDANENAAKDDDEPWVKTEGFHEALTKKKVRQAINMAIDKKSIVRDLYMGTASVAKNGMPPFMLGYNDDIRDWPYDPERAKKLLAEAGYPNGFDVVFYVMPVSRPYMFDPPKIGEAIQSYLAAVGINASIYQVDWATYLQETQLAKHQMCLLGWTGDNGDPDNFMNVLYGPNSTMIGTAGNYGFYNDMEAQKLLTAALQTYDIDKRAEYYSKFQEMIHESANYVYLAHANQNAAFRKNVKGYRLHPTSRKFFYPCYIE
jgi:ABC-type transport system substrate-binding protein